MDNLFKLNDKVIVNKGEYKGQVGRVVDEESPILWVMVDETEKVVISIDQKDLLKVKKS